MIKHTTMTNLSALLKTVAFVFATAICAHAQVFTDLNFEQAVVTPGNYPGTGTATLPGWTVNIGGTPVTVIQEAPTEDNVLDYTSGELVPAPESIQGNYSMFLYGVGTIGQTSSNASISQTGNIPFTAKSINFLTSQASFAAGYVESIPLVTLNGNAINVIELSTSNGVTTYVGDISAYAGTTASLEFQAAPVPSTLGFPYSFENQFLVDSISFSSTPAPTPEPSTVGLAMLGGLGLFILAIRLRATSSAPHE